MKLSILTRAGLLAGLVALAPGLATALPGGTTERPLTKEQLDASLGFLGKLLGTSSVAYEVNESHFQPAITYLEQAREMHRRAGEKLAEGDLEDAKSLRDESLRLALEAAHLARMVATGGKTPQVTHENMRRTVLALLTAYSSVASEKGRLEDARKLNREAASLLDRADLFAAQNDYGTASRIAGEAYHMVKGALIVLRGGETLGKLSMVQPGREAPSLVDVDSKIRSINSLLEAQQRIAEEKHITGAEQLQVEVPRMLDEARKLAEQGKADEARHKLDIAYTSVKASIETMRGGETLVRSLHFETKEEEYQYEIDRNDTYRMLIRMLVRDGRVLEENPRIKQALDDAASLRIQAEQEAGQGAFGKGVESLEESTQFLIRALRNAGVMILG